MSLSSIADFVEVGLDAPAVPMTDTIRPRGRATAPATSAALLLALNGVYSSIIGDAGDCPARACGEQLSGLDQARATGSDQLPRQLYMFSNVRPRYPSG